VLAQLCSKVGNGLGGFSFTEWYAEKVSSGQEATDHLNTRVILTDAQIVGVKPIGFSLGDDEQVLVLVARGLSDTEGETQLVALLLVEGRFARVALRVTDDSLGSLDYLSTRKASRELHLFTYIRSFHSILLRLKWGISDVRLFLCIKILKTNKEYHI